MAPTGGIEKLDAATRTQLKEIKLEDIDFPAVTACKDKHVLKRYIKLLEDDGSYFVDLLKACKDKLLEVDPKEYYLLYPISASPQEVDEATRDILNWEEAVKETDAALRESKKKVSKDLIWDDLPGRKVTAPVRGQEPVMARANTNREERFKGSDQKENRDVYARDKSRMKDYYSAWDKVDVDAIEAEMDAEEREEEESRKRHFDELREQQDDAQAVTPIRVELDADGIPEAHRRHMADSEKEKGNEAFYAKDFEEAEAYYSRSIHYKADDPSSWANRALVRLKLEKPAQALEDCEHSLALNPRYMKALHRKGKALVELDRPEEAVRTFQLALAESPGNTQINGDLCVARRKLRQAEVQARPRRVDDEPSCRIEELVEEDEKPPAASARAPAPRPGYTRVQIEEDSDSDSEGDAAAPAPGSRPAAPAGNSGGTAGGYHKVVIEEVSGSEDEEPPAPVAAAAAPRSPQQAPAPVFRKVQIEEDSDSEGEEPTATGPSGGSTAAMAFSPPPRVAPAGAPAPPEPAPPAPTSGALEAASGAVSFDDMD